MKEVTEWDGNPREMLVWNDDENFKATSFVVFIEPSSREYPYTRVVTWNASTGDLNWCKHCAEIKSQRRMTNKELARWLREKPNREYKLSDKEDADVYSAMAYGLNREDEPVPYNVWVREGDGPWFVPFKEQEDD